ncbi:MAG: DUF4358 domain-containing protein [Oscillospiraceae bacterium]|nr:DUF4358 domain-containing protein [Oscillospiraceae bacterium]
MKKIIIALFSIFALTIGIGGCTSNSEERQPQESPSISEPDVTTPITESDTSPPITEPDATYETAETVSLTAGELALAVREDFPMAMIEHTEIEAIEIFLPGVNFDDIDEISLWQQAMTVHLVEIIIIKPAQDKMDEVMDFLLERQKNLKEQLAFYPAQITAAEASVVGNLYDVAYLICQEDAKASEATLIKLIEESVQ